MDNYEEKYKSALKWMQSLYGGLHGATKEEAEKYFPELKEPNDERIRKELIAIFSVGAKVNAKTGDIPDRDIVAWLEKPSEKDFCICIGCTNDKGCVTCENGNLKEIKIEPKFKVGDWVVFPLGIIGRIDTLDDVNYHVTTTDGYNFDYKILKQHFYHLYLWSINDAKDGDVLYSLDSNQPFIYKERPQFSQARGYCCINKFGEFAVWNTIKCVICTEKYIPATKEQRELLFQKMKKAGYEWNSEKKELKKIESKTLDADRVIIKIALDVMEKGGEQ